MPDEEFEAEYSSMISFGIICSLYSAEDFQDGAFQPKPSLENGGEVIYRGWMLSIDSYRQLESAITRVGSRLITSHFQYEHCHHLPNWYPLLTELTPKTFFSGRMMIFMPNLKILGGLLILLKIS
jgi:hypothetical protein